MGARLSSPHPWDFPRPIPCSTAARKASVSATVPTPWKRTAAWRILRPREPSVASERSWEMRDRGSRPCSCALLRHQFSASGPRRGMVFSLTPRCSERPMRLVGLATIRYRTGWPAASASSSGESSRDSIRPYPSGSREGSSSRALWARMEVPLRVSSIRKSSPVLQLHFRYARSESFGRPWTALTVFDHTDLTIRPTQQRPPPDHRGCEDTRNTGGGRNHQPNGPTLAPPAEQLPEHRHRPAPGPARDPHHRRRDHPRPPGPADHQELLEPGPTGRTPYPLPDPAPTGPRQPGRERPDQRPARLRHPTVGHRRGGPGPGRDRRPQKGPPERRGGPPIAPSRYAAGRYPPLCFWWSRNGTTGLRARHDCQPVSKT